MAKKRIDPKEEETRLLAEELVTGIMPILGHSSHPAVALAALKDAAFNIATGIAIHMGGDVRSVMQTFSRTDIISKEQWEEWQRESDIHRSAMERAMEDPDFMDKVMGLDSIRGKA